MNKMLTPNGGVPLKLTDIAYMQDAIRNAFEGLLNGISTDGNIRLAGCEVTRQEVSGGNEKITWTSGWVALHGEVFIVASGDIASVPNGTKLFWKITRLPEAEITLANGEKGARREKSYAVLVPESLKDEQSVNDAELYTVGKQVLRSNTQLTTKRDIEIKDKAKGLVTAYMSYNSSPLGYKSIVAMFYGQSVTDLTNGKLCGYTSDIPMDGCYMTCIQESRGIGERLIPCILRLYKKEVKLYDMKGQAITNIPYMFEIILDQILPNNI